MAGNGFIDLHDLMAWPTGSLSSSFEPESLAKEATSNEKTSVWVRVRESVGVVTAEEERHSEASVLGFSGLLRAPPGFESVRSSH
ncbi:hypothetical protein Nepgr_025534 [Nepenthes gracilis]|uniref:Uncharacterized protein n=1 Tax=Nepenthes gracilis TaxID=150966 RepID=A0AAD3T7Z3_NEPGR|nr:hypothetical protein Nepgr_025534 [Nepenthes gracilis]